ncbi:MAG: glycosyltransferase [bacterium]|nr:glycosyltransferase [bacterium]
MSEDIDSKIDSKEIRKILLIRSAPVERVNNLIKDLRARFPKAHITVLVQPEVSGQFPGVDDTILYRERRFDLLKGLKCLPQIRKRRYDLVIVPYNTSSGVGCFNVELFSLLVRTRHRIGYDIDGYTHNLSLPFYLSILIAPLRLLVSLCILLFVAIWRHPSNIKRQKGRNPCIGIDARGLSRGTGIQRYIYNLIKHLSLEEDEFVYTIFKGTQKSLFSYSNLRERIVKIPMYNWQEQVFFSQELLSQKVDLFWGTNFIIPLIMPCKSILTIYDLTFLHFHGQNPVQTERWIRLSAKSADRIIAISKSTKRDIVRFLHIPENKIKVIYPGIDHRVYCVSRDPKLIESARDRYNLLDRYILSIGSAGRRKNYIGMIKACHRLKKEGVFYKLVLVGGRNFFPEEIFAAIEGLELKDDIIFTGYVPEEDLPLLYNGAELFVYPSFFEGFGLPVLEAMACGTPVVTSNTSSLPEVAGDAAILVDPNNIEDMAYAIYKALTDNTLKKEMREKGLRQASKFSWEKCARETLGVCKEVLGI